MCKCLPALMLALSLAAIGCGGDDDAAPGIVDSCSAGIKSVPGSDMDPCPQDQCCAAGDTACQPAMYATVATCDPTGHWAKDAMKPTTIKCECVAKGGMVVTTKPCGNGVIDRAIGETCDGMVLDGMTCQKMMGMKGMLACDPMTCKFDAKSCTEDNTGGGGTGP